MARRIPPLNPLRVFEVVARTENLTTAAEELHVTQSAVSRQIGVLETYLGVELFRRERHGVVLTRLGRAYGERIIPAFSEISAATEQLVKGTSQGALRVRTYTTFAAKWLIPRLPEFHRLHPNVEVRISNAVPDVDFDRDPVDVAIQFGEGQWQRTQCDLLFHDEIEPVCSPGYIEKHLTVDKRPESLLRERLLVSHYRRIDWDDWLSATHMTQYAATAERMNFGTSVLTWQAAINGLGIAIGQNALLAEEFRSGQLTRPFTMPVRRDKAYYLVRPEMQRESRKVALFRDWLLNEVKDIGRI
ncbi:transcriptional regulator GcvA [Noviherbaspirillum sp. Root189]|uniref:transcriptional regulator GcvA n=1 Tax=Noviherbaspirillum sp. Root189 TaxID=1736487 RepID=UPI00070E349A|nr:transcriptional regulator GcvA [Noviherbaspirillum sp. Root189]KRB93511.1 LysR family transcriptional regulator [Noviherbaspirillum sp. Root189]